MTISETEYQELLDTISRLEEENGYLTEQLDKVNTKVEYIFKVLPTDTLGNLIRKLWKI